MQSSLVSLSNDLAKIVEEFQAHVVAVHARGHYPSSGVHWRPGFIVTANHTIRHDEYIQVTLPSGKRIDAALSGRDAGTDIAVLKLTDWRHPPLGRAGAIRQRWASWRWCSDALRTAGRTPAWE